MDTNLGLIIILIFLNQIGCNDNPNPQQFRSAYRKLCYEANLVISDRTNVHCLSTTDILKVTSVPGRKSNSLNNSMDDNSNGFQDFEMDPELEEYTQFDIEQLLMIEQGGCQAHEAGAYSKRN